MSGRQDTTVGYQMKALIFPAAYRVNNQYLYFVPVLYFRVEFLAAVWKLPANNPRIFAFYVKINPKCRNDERAHPIVAFS